MDKQITDIISIIKSSRNFNVLTGAGISTLSGIPDFRGEKGVYKAQNLGCDIETILSIGYFKKHPDIFYDWAKDVWYHLENYKPNIVHSVLAKLERQGYLKNIFTQNIDSLHERAGSKKVYNLHGSAADAYCTECGLHYSYEDIATIITEGKVPYCKRCNGLIKPDIVLYGEPLNEHVLSRAITCSSQSDVFMVLGSSLTVQPAASLPLYAAENKAKIIIVNKQDTYLDRYATIKADNLESVFTSLDELL
ncbi:MAG: NAD-dependent protein deacylase [Spirochaetales bacterium]|nr:NAD-dependent protein deacylase [Spirochaetales bacterium]